MIHVLERNDDQGLMILRTESLKEAYSFILDGGYPEACEAAKCLEETYYANYVLDIYVFIDTLRGFYEFEIESL